MRTDNREPNPNGLLPVFLCLPFMGSHLSTAGWPHWQRRALHLPQIQISFCAVRSVISSPVFSTPLGSISISFTSRSA